MSCTANLELVKFQFTHPGGVRRGDIRLITTTNVSIHAPGRGATGNSEAIARLSSSFNSRTREGCDVSL